MPLVVQADKSIPFDIIEINRRWVAVSRFPITDSNSKVIGVV
jgi:hypothetical protein